MDSKGSALVYFHEAKLDPPMLVPLVAAVPLENLYPVSKGHLTEKTICKGMHRNQEARCIILDIKKGKSVEQLRIAELSGERAEEYEEKGRRWADELRGISEQAQKKSNGIKRDDERSNVSGRMRPRLTPAPSALRTTPYPKRARSRSTMSPDSDVALSEEISDKSCFVPAKASAVKTFQPLRSHDDEYPLGMGISLRERANRGQSLAGVGSCAHRASIVRGASRRRSASVYNRRSESRAKSLTVNFPNLLCHETPIPEVHTFVQWGQDHGIDIVGLQDAINMESNIGPAFLLALHTLFTEAELKESFATAGGAKSKRAPLIEQERLKIAVALVRGYCKKNGRSIPNSKQLSYLFTNAKKQPHMSWSGTTGADAEMEEDVESQRSASHHDQ